MGDATITVTDANFESEVLQSDTPILVDFWAEWCGPCRAMAPVLDELAEQHKGRLKVAKLDIDSNTATAQQYRILSIPTLLVFENGQVAKQLVGAMPRKQLENELAEWVSTPAT